MDVLKLQPPKIFGGKWLKTALPAEHFDQKFFICAYKNLSNLTFNHFSDLEILFAVLCWSVHMFTNSLSSSTIFMVSTMDSRQEICNRTIKICTVMFFTV